MKRIALFLLFIITLFHGISAEVIGSEQFKITLKKDGVSTFYFTPSEVIAFKSYAEDANNVAVADFSVNWRIFIDNGFTLTLEAKSENTESDSAHYCLMRSDGLIGLNYLIAAGSKTAGSESNQAPLSKADRTIVLVENFGSTVLPVEGSEDVSLSIPWPSSSDDIVVNGIYQGYLILTLTTN